LTQKEFDFTEGQLTVYKEKSAIETFRFIDLENFSSENVTLPIDKIVADMVKRSWLAQKKIGLPFEK
jgi:hypothetical protein